VFDREPVVLRAVKYRGRLRYVVRAASKKEGIIKDRSERMKRNWKYDWERKREIKIDNESNKKTKKTKKGFCLFFAFFKKQMTCSQ